MIFVVVLFFLFFFSFLFTNCSYFLLCFLIYERLYTIVFCFSNFCNFSPSLYLSFFSFFPSLLLFDLALWDYCVIFHNLFLFIFISIVIVLLYTSWLSFYLFFLCELVTFAVILSYFFLYLLYFIWSNISFPLQPELQMKCQTCQNLISSQHNRQSIPQASSKGSRPYQQAEWNRQWGRGSYWLRLQDHHSLEAGSYL